MQVNRKLIVALLAVGVATTLLLNATPLDFKKGTPQIKSMSALTFSKDAVLFIGDGKGGKIFAIALDDNTPREKNDALNIANIEAKLAGFLGTSTDEVLIHDLAVNPISQNAYLAVSRGGAKWESRWTLPNDLADANILVKISPDGEMSAVSLENINFAQSELPNPVDSSKMHRWKEGVSLRVDTITDMVYANGTLYVAGLSNEEFASTMWRVPFPFEAGTTTTTLEIFHGAHGQYETHAPIRAFVPYQLQGRDHLLAAYLCTPLVTFPVTDLKDGEHVKGRTVAEFGSGNYPVDMLVYEKGEHERLLIANSNLPFMIVDPGDVERFEGEITTEVEGYLAGVNYEPRSGTGVQQMDNFNPEFILALQRLPGGTLDLVSLPIRRF